MIDNECFPRIGSDEVLVFMKIKDFPIEGYL